LVVFNPSPCPLLAAATKEQVNNDKGDYDKGDCAAADIHDCPSFFSKERITAPNYAFTLARMEFACKVDTAIMRSVDTRDLGAQRLGLRI
jgi:hypothetical protein